MSDLFSTFLLVLAMAMVASRAMRGFTREEQKILWASFAAHQLAGFANIWVARYYYGYGDMLTYHASGVIIADGLRSDFWDLAPSLVSIIFHRPTPLPVPVDILVSSSGAMQAIAGFCSFFFFDSLYGTCAFIAGLGFFSKIALYLAARAELPHLPRRALLLSCTLVPSVVFWSSALLKEPVALIGLFFALYGYHRLLCGRARAQSLSLIAAGTAVVFVVKPYILPVFGVSAAIWYLVHRVQSRGVDVVLQMWHVVLGATAAISAIVLTGVLLPKFALDALQEQLATNQSVGAGIDAGSNYTLGAASGSTAGQLALAPVALITALFRPALFEAKSPLIFINALEMTAFTIATVRVPFRRGLIQVVAELIRQPFLTFCLLFTVSFGTFTALGTTNLGTLSRYRAPMVPFFATLLFALLARPSRVASPAVTKAPKPAALPVASS